MEDFIRQLKLEEKSPYTIQKYTHDIKDFLAYTGETPVCKELAIDYKQDLIRRGYQTGTVNSMISSVNSFLRFLKLDEIRVRHIRTQQKIYCPEEKELTKAEYIRLLEAARPKPRLYMIIETICATGIRISELKYFTVEAVTRGEVVVSCKNKTRNILLPAKLRKKLMKYSRRQGIREGVIFRTRSGRPMDRSNIWLSMKKLCQSANVMASKVFPHNLRKLFARTFYNIEKDIAKLADLLGHSNINTTRIYIMTTSMEHRRKIDKMGLVV